ncbi:MAG: T9SS type A sorting domain-containing protein [Ignavibacteria bacterium]
MNRFFNLLFVLLISAAFTAASDSKNYGTETRDYKMSLSHLRKINDNTFEFDVFIKTSGKRFVLENYQCAFNFDNNLPANTIQFDYITNSSELQNSPVLSAALTNEEGKKLLVFASHPSGSDTIQDNEVRIGRFKVRTINPNGDSILSVSWNFKGDINTIISASSKNITNPANHLDSEGNASNSNESLLPKVYALSQNYPNPFNPSTSIRFSLPFDSRIKISVYNALGELVAHLADKIEQAGNYDVTWNASGISSGLYIYTIEAEPLKGGSTFKSVKKMMLLK